MGNKKSRWGKYGVLIFFFLAAAFGGSRCFSWQYKAGSGAGLLAGMAIGAFGVVLWGWLSSRK